MDTPIPAEQVTLPTRGWHINQRHAILAGVLCWMGLAFIAWLVLTGRAAGFDAAGLQAFRRKGDLGLAASPGTLEVVRDITALGGPVLRWLFTFAAVAALLFLRLKREAVLLGATVLFGLLVNSGLKLLIGRPRPTLVPHLTDAGGLSFPSGHSFNAALCFLATALAFATISNRHSVRWTMIAAAAAISMVVAFTRVVLGVHYPTDVIAGWLGGAGWAFLAAGLLYQPAKAVADSAG